MTNVIAERIAVALEAILVQQITYNTIAEGILEVQKGMLTRVLELDEQRKEIKRLRQRLIAIEEVAKS